MTAPGHGSAYFRKGFGLRNEVADSLSSDYNGQLVDLIRARDYALSVDGLTVRLAREFGFCYGVERAVEYAYQTRRKFPDRRVVLLGEIIHNPHVNTRLREMGIEILAPQPDGAPGVQRSFDYDAIAPSDVVILPAFGVTIQDFETLRAIGSVIVDTTCGSVLNVWKRVESYARDGFTAVIHGKVAHEETRATASQVLRYPEGRYLIVRHMEEAQHVCDFIAGVPGASAALLRERFGHAWSPGFDPEQHLVRVGVANQTTMLARESLAIGEAIGQAMERRFGAAHRAEHFRTFDTICSATQDRQDAVEALLAEPPPLDCMVVVGGFNSSNTISLAALCAERVPTYHVADATSIDPATGTIAYREAGVRHVEATRAGWLASSGEVRVGLTAGASTPNNKIGDTIARIFATRGIVLTLPHATAPALDGAGA